MVTGAAPVDKAKVSPTKAFFVYMLTRDISLSDAILDLVDNSLDGVLRDGAPTPDYTRYFVELEVRPDLFQIKDNAGGIPRPIARESAFRMGREILDTRDDTHETIGMYGVGLKRAIFKMGKSAVVRTRNGDDHYQVEFRPAWLDDPGWDEIPLDVVADGDRLPTPGTSIRVTDLYPGIHEEFSKDHFVDELKKALGEHFVVFLERGFRINVNGEAIAPTKIRILIDDEGPAPYYFQTALNGTQIRLAVGINPGASLDAEDDPDDPMFVEQRSYNTAGWTIFCNDRAVLVGDKTRLTGWGDSAPLFHPQFSLITGIVEFRATHARDLPVTTTKRALDTSAEAWLIARNAMRDGLVVFTRHTTRWKNIAREEQAPFWQRARAATIAEIAQSLETRGLSDSRKIKGARFFDPTSLLPKPASSKAAQKRISFSRPKEKVEFLASVLLDDPKSKASLVGEECFDRVYRIQGGPE